MRGNSAGVGRQYISLLQRVMELYWNDRRKVIVTILLPVVIGGLVALVTDTDKVGTFYESTENILFTIVSAAIYIGMFNSLTSICKERSIIKREYMTGMSLSAYVLAQVTFQAVLCAVQTEIFMMIFWKGDSVGFRTESCLSGSAGMTDNVFVQYFITLFLIMLAADMMGMFVSSVVHTAEIANLVAPVIIIIQLVMAGVLYELSGVMSHVANITISKWGTEALGSVTGITKMKKLVTDVDDWDSIKEIAGDMASFDKDEKAMFEATYSHVVHHWGILLLFVVVLTVLCIIALKRVEKDKR